MPAQTGRGRGPGAFSLHPRMHARCMISLSSTLTPARFPLADFFLQVLFFFFERKFSPAVLFCEFQMKVLHASGFLFLL